MTDDEFKTRPEYTRTMVAKFEGGEIWIADGQFIVLGSPFTEDPNAEEFAHNCDALGCGSAHVVYREVIPTAQEMGALFDQKVEDFNRGIAEGSTCYWCSEAAKVPLSTAKTEHFRTCEKSPLVQENERLRELLREARAVFGCVLVTDVPIVAVTIQRIDAALAGSDKGDDK